MPPSHRARNRFAFFGQLNPYKGADVLLRAMDILGEDFDGELRIYGGEPRDAGSALAGALRRRCCTSATT